MKQYTLSLMSMFSSWLFTYYSQHQNTQPYQPLQILKTDYTGISQILPCREIIPWLPKTNTSILIYQVPPGIFCLDHVNRATSEISPIANSWLNRLYAF